MAQRSRSRRSIVWDIQDIEAHIRDLIKQTLALEASALKEPDRKSVTRWFNIALDALLEARIRLERRVS